MTSATSPNTPNSLRAMHSVSGTYSDSFLPSREGLQILSTNTPAFHAAASTGLQFVFTDGLASQSTPTSQAEPKRRKRGRPRVKELVIGPKRPRGRPRKAVHDQQDARGDAGTVQSPVKRRRGRPPKIRLSGGVVVEFGRYTVPGRQGTFHAPPPHAPLPTSCPASNPTPERRSNEGPPPKRTPTTVSGSSSSPGGHPSPPVWEIVPPSNPECLLDEEDNQDPSDGDGIGQEEDGDDRDDEKDDEREPDREDPSADAAGKPRRIRKPLAPWLREAYNVHVADLEKRNEDGLTHLYASDRTFWCRQPSSWFLLHGGEPSPRVLYNPRFFVWDPQMLYKDLPCPSCRHVLHRHTAMSYPRRCVDTTSSFWIIGYRYRCRHCRHPKTGKATVTWRSWDQRILAVLPPTLAAEFPAHLSHRSGISKPLFSWMRSCFQNGMGSKQFSDSLRVQHLLRYDELHLQYLDYLASSLSMERLMGRKFQSFLPFDDTSPDGPHGFVPSARWLRDMYDSFMEEHRHDFNQHTAMLTAEICAIDHSHKITKHVAKFNGQRVFCGLLTVTNEKGEIRSCNLVATKAHSQFELALTRMRESLELYGHRQPELFYTDNMADKSFLESSFPSLRRDVVPVEKYGDLEPFVLPADVQVCVRQEEQAINAALSTIVDQIPAEESDPELVVGFDCEWNVSISSDGRHERGEIAIIQIAFEKRVYILQISELLAHRCLPEKLAMLLQNPRVRKVGHRVNSDLKQLQNAVGSSLEFTGALDLAQYAKERHVIPNACCSLGDLCAAVLKRRLNKNVSERLSAAWEHPNLTTEQEHYAACDAYVPLLMFHKLSRFTVPKPLAKILVPLTPVLLYNTDNTVVVASGHLASNLDIRQFDGVNITATRTLVDVTEVLVPAAIISSHAKRSLASFGPTPFSIVFLQSHLRIFDPFTFSFATAEVITPAGPPPVLTAAASSNVPPPTPQLETLETVNFEYDADESEAAAGLLDGTGSLLRLSLGAGLNEGTSSEDMIMSDPEPSTSTSPTNPAEHEVDPHSQACVTTSSEDLARNS